MNNDYIHATQWAFNPSVYQNMANDEVDWATLAQQWIKMKETCPQVTTSMMVPPPPPPVIGPTSSSAPSKDPNKEEGEAPMEMDNGKDDTEDSMGAVSGDGQNWGQWGSNWNQWSWGWGQIDPKIGATPPTAETSSYLTQTPAFTPAEVISAQAHPYNQEYWTSSNSDSFVASKGDSWTNSSRRGSRRRSRDRERKEEPENSEPPILDAAKRRSLPAWIREGLEKMEREKHKKLQEELLRQERLQHAAETANRESSQEPSNDPKTLMKSKFDSDSENEESEGREGPNMQEEPHQTRFRGSLPLRHSRTSPLSKPPPIFKSKEQIMEETMLKVRRVLTQILMEVTTHEMEKVVNQVHSVMRKKAPAPRHEKAPQSSSVTGKLGLGIYDSESDNSSGEEETVDKKDGDESDKELKDRILRKKRDFQRVEREIEVQIEQEEEKERRILSQNDSGDSHSESDAEADELVHAKHSSSKELDPRMRQLDTVNKGQVPPSFQPPAELASERSKGGSKVFENHREGIHENRSIGDETPAAEKATEKVKSKVREKSKERNTAGDSDSSSSNSSDSSSSSSSSTSSYSSSDRHSKSIRKTKRRRKEHSGSKRSYGQGRSRMYSSRSRKRSVESESSSSSKRRANRSSSRDSRSKVSSKKSRHSSERSSRRHSVRRSRSRSRERKQRPNRTHSNDRRGASWSRTRSRSRSRSRSPSRHSHRSSSHRRPGRRPSRSSHSRYSRSPSSKSRHSRSSKDRSRRDKRRSHHSDSSPDSSSGSRKRSRR